MIIGQGLILRVLLLIATTAGVHAGGELLRRAWTVDGVTREALVWIPTENTPAPWPVVFVFHGHGGTMREASWSQPVHKLWPEAVVAYLQGLPTPGRLTDADGDWSGWQAGPGAEGDRDLKFFDAVLDSLRADHPIDAKRIYATGHSNGGAFTYLLWAKRRDVFAAFGPSAAVAGRDFGRLEPAPVIHIAGENDELVRFPWQKLMLKVLGRTNECGPGQAVGEGLTRFESKLGAPVEFYVHPGGHRYPTKATALIVAFFKANARP